MLTVEQEGFSTLHILPKLSYQEECRWFLVYHISCSMDTLLSYNLPRESFHHEHVDHAVALKMSIHIFFVIHKRGKQNLNKQNIFHSTVQFKVLNGTPHKTDSFINVGHFYAHLHLNVDYIAFMPHKKAQMTLPWCKLHIDVQYFHSYKYDLILYAVAVGWGCCTLRTSSSL